MTTKPIKRAKATDIRAGILEPVLKLAAKIRKGAEQTEAAADGLDRRDLKPEAVRRQERELRRLFSDRFRGDAQAATAMLDAISAQAAHYSPAAIKARARFEDAATGLLWMKRIETASGSELAEIARLAASDGAVAVAYSVEREVLRRSDRSDPALAVALELARSVELPPEDLAAAAALEEARRMVEAVQIEFAEAVDGRPRVVDRLTAAYEAGPSEAPPSPPVVEAA